jgi:hypothetical protein
LRSPNLVLAAGHEAQRDRAVFEAGAAEAGSAAVGDRLGDAGGDVGDARHEVVEEAVAAALGLDHRELEGRVGEGARTASTTAAQVGEVVAGDDAVDVEVEAAAAEVGEGGEGLVEGLGADHEVVDLGAAAVQREVHVAQARASRAVDELRVGEHAAVGDEAEVEAEAGDEVGPVQELGADRRLAAREHDHARRGPADTGELGGAADLGLDLGGAALDVADLEGVAEGAVLVAAVADLEKRLHPGATITPRPGWARSRVKARRRRRGGDSRPLAR